jgi:hypothetical protein
MVVPFWTPITPLTGFFLHADPQTLADNPVTQAIFDTCIAVISDVDAPVPNNPRHIELHQFRIETTPDHIGRPTPEGLHRDGVDWVFVML